MCSSPSPASSGCLMPPPPAFVAPTTAVVPAESGAGAAAGRGGGTAAGGRCSRRKGTQAQVEVVLLRGHVMCFARVRKPYIMISVHACQFLQVLYGGRCLSSCLSFVIHLPVERATASGAREQQAGVQMRAHMWSCRHQPCTSQPANRAPQCVPRCVCFASCLANRPANIGRAECGARSQQPWARRACWRPCTGSGPQSC